MMLLMGPDKLATDPDPLQEFVGRLLEVEPWRKRAACRGNGQHVDAFFGAPAERPETRAVREWDTHQQFCSQCPVAGECKAAAREGAEFGYWSGENEEDRARAGFGNDALVGNASRDFREWQRRQR